jgi:hypothetical protein
MAKARTEEVPVAAAEAAGEEAAESQMIDLSDVPDEQEYPVIPRAVYPALVDDLTFGYSQSSGNPMWTWRFEVSDGEHTGHKLFFHTPFVENMMPRVKKVLARIAPELLSGPFNPEQVAMEGSLIGRACRIRVDIRPYQGKQRNNVRDVLPAAEGGDFLGEQV